MWFLRNDIFIQNMHIIESHIKQRIGLINPYIEIMIKEIIEMIFFWLIVVWIHIQEDGV